MGLSPDKCSVCTSTSTICVAYHNRRAILTGFGVSPDKRSVCTSTSTICIAWAMLTGRCFIIYVAYICVLVYPTTWNVSGIAYPQAKYVHTPRFVTRFVCCTSSRAVQVVDSLAVRVLILIDNGKLLPFWIIFSLPGIAADVPEEQHLMYICKKKTEITSRICRTHRLTGVRFYFMAAVQTTLILLSGYSYTRSSILDSNTARML